MFIGAIAAHKDKLNHKKSFFAKYVHFKQSQKDSEFVPLDGANIATIS